MLLRKYWSAIGVQLIILILLIAYWKIACTRTMPVVDVQMDKWSANQAVWEEGWTCPAGTVVTISSPFLSIMRGTYTLEISYSSETNETLTMTAPENMHTFVHGGNIRLYPLQHVVQTDFTVDQGIDNLVLSLTTGGRGSVTVRDIRIVRNRNDLGQICALYIVCTVLFDLCFIQRRIWHWEKRLFLGFYVLLLFTALPLLIPGIQVGQDLRFHFMRLEGLWRELARGYIPSRVQSSWFSGYGYPVSIYYGDILLYPAAALRIMGVPLVTAYKFYLFMINYLTVLSSVLCFKRMTRSDWKTLLVSASYALANYRLYDVYIRAGVGEMSAFVFYPMILLGFYEMIGCHGFSWQLALRDACLIAVGIAGIICNHMLSGEMTLITLGLVALFYLPSIVKKQGIVTLGFGAILSLMLAAYFVIPFLDMYRSIEVKINGSLSGGNGHMIQQFGAFWGQYFAFTEKIDGYSVEEANVRFALTPGPVLMITLILGAAALYLGDNRGKIWRPLFLAVLMLYISSNLFPWNVMALRTRIGRILAQVQFPWRYLSMAVVFLSVIQLVLLEHPKCEQYRLTISLVVLMLCCYSTCDYLSQYVSGATITKAWDMGEISDSAAMNYEYWREGCDGELFTDELRTSEGITVSQYDRQGLRTALTCSADRDGAVTLPQVNYGHMMALTDDEQVLTVSDGENNQVMIEIPSGFDGTVICDYKEPLYWRISEFISITGLIFCLAFIRTGRKYAR